MEKDHLTKRCLAILIAILCGTAHTALAQDNTHNYVRTRTMLDPRGSSCLDRVEYHDGLGRHSQTVLRNFTPQGGQLFTLHEYDLSDRLSADWNGVWDGGEYLSPAAFRSSSASLHEDSRGFTETVYEAFPSGPACRKYAPGESWQTHPSTVAYLSNSTSRPCTCYGVDAAGGLTCIGSYAEGTLCVVRTADEDGCRTDVFTDFSGRTVLERRMAGTAAHDTYYVYDDFGNLCFVLQPMYQETADLGKYAFQYRYDHRNRCVWKKLPGAEPTTYEYDNNDRLTFSQDGNQRAATTGNWTYYKYDHLNRLTEQGTCTDKNTASGTTVQIRNCYDNYDFVGTSGFTDSRFTKDTSGHSKGSLTGSMAWGSGVCGPVYTAYYYDLRGREVKRVESNAMGGYDVTTTAYTFTGKPQTVTHTHSSSSKSLTEVTTYSYDHADRLGKVQHKLDGGATVTLAEYAYDNLGRLQSKKLGGTAHTAAFTYNIRGWLTGITGSKFSQSLTYNNGTAGYNGNITAMSRTANGIGHAYTFAYDGLNRLTDAVHSAGRYTERVTAYDKNGNIKNLQRYGQTSASAYGLIDDLTFTLNGNRLSRVDDAATASAYGNGFEFKDGAKQADEYAYDANGNLTKDLNKNITNIRYNFLNLPIYFSFKTGGFLQHGYTADGVRRRTIYKELDGPTSPVTTVYCGNVIYENNVPRLLLHEEGYVTLDDNKYHYYVKDHQGNNCLVVDSSGAVEETNHYYPFVPGGASSAIKALRGADKVTDAIQAMNRGRRNEAKVLESIGEVKNTKSMITTLDKTGERITVILDVIPDTKVVEVKDVKNLSNTKQIRGERQIAEKEGKKFEIITGENTHVSGNIKDSEIVRRKDIGPQ